MATQETPPRNGPAGANKRLGDSGERFVAGWLEARGHTILTRNWRCAWGELDIITRDGTEVVFVEVKTRRGAFMGTPEEAITPTKRRRLVQSAWAWLVAQELEDAPFRIDVVSVALSPAGKLLEVRHYPRCIEEEAL